MTAIKVQNQRTERAVIDSEDVVAATTASVQDQLEVTDLVGDEPPKPSGVIPGNAGINDPGGVNELVIVRNQAQTAFETVNEDQKPLVSIPTADLISHTSFKSGSKFVIRIIPMQDNKSKDTRLRTQVDSDASLYFDKASLQATSEVYEERYQLFESFDGETLFLFGERPKIWNFQFIITNATRPTVPSALNAQGAEQALEAFMRRWNMDFTDEFLRRYDKYYRGTSALRMKARVFMSYEDILIEATLLGMVASRNNTLAGAANIGITFVVHRRQFMGESLTFGSDNTLAALLAGDDLAAIVRSKIVPTSIVPPKKTVKELLAEYTQNQDEAQQSQAQATELQTEAAAVAAAGAQAAIELEAIEELAAEYDAAIQETSDPEERASLIAQREELYDQARDAQSRVQDAAAVSEARAEELSTAALENDIAVSRQRTSETKLQQSPEGDMTQSLQTITWRVRLVTANGDGTRTASTFREATEAEANLLAAQLVSGTTPSGAGFVDEQTFDVNDPAFSGFVDGVTVFKERANT